MDIHFKTPFEVKRRLRHDGSTRVGTASHGLTSRKNCAVVSIGSATCRRAPLPITLSTTLAEPSSDARASMPYSTPLTESNARITYEPVWLPSRATNGTAGRL